MIAARRVVLGQGDALEIDSAALRLDGSRIAEVRRLAADRYRDDLKRWADETRLPSAATSASASSPPPSSTPTPTWRSASCAARPRPSPCANMVREFYFGIEQNLEPEDILAFTRMGAYESLLSGVGLVWDHYYHGEAVAEGSLRPGSRAS